MHAKKDSGEVFYVGKGSFRKDRRPTYERATADHSRNRKWRNIVKKHGFKAIILTSCQTDEEAQRIEKQMVAEIGRADTGRGPLVNFTDGGDGHCGILVGDELREKRRISASRKRTAEWVEAIRKARKNGGNGGVVKKGDRLPQWWRNRIAASKYGAMNPMYGRTGKDHPNTRRVINVKTNGVYESVTQAADANGYKMKTLYNWLTGHRKNPTDLRFI
ncbi:MAG: hypothetical protein ABIJ26_07810 [Candidatus Margulisiibacteriota bacterium]